jgi:hypothetical protein
VLLTGEPEPIERMVGFAVGDAAAAEFVVAWEGVSTSVQICFDWVE